MREIASLEAVCETADTLVAEGLEPSIVAVQTRIGGGSYSTVKKHLTAWAEKRAKAALSTPAVPTEVTTKAQEFGRVVWAIAATAAQQEIQKAQELAQAEVKTLRHELAEATAVIVRLEAIEAEQAEALEAAQSELRVKELEFVAAQTTAEQVPKLEQALAEARGTATAAQQEITRRATEAGKLTGELEAMRQQVQELMLALKKQ